MIELVWIAVGGIIGVVSLGILLQYLIDKHSEESSFGVREIQSKACVICNNSMFGQGDTCSHPVCEGTHKARRNFEFEHSMYYKALCEERERLKAMDGEEG